jgi:hypothetical protein
MYVVELILKNVSMSISVQRKEAADAEHLYRQLSDTIKASAPGQMIELTCEQQTEKKVTVDAAEVVAVQTYSKSGAPASGRATGFGASATTPS